MTHLESISIVSLRYVKTLLGHASVYEWTRPQISFCSAECEESLTEEDVGDTNGEPANESSASREVDKPAINGRFENFLELN